MRYKLAKIGNSAETYCPFSNRSVIEYRRVVPYGSRPVGVRKPRRFGLNLGQPGKVIWRRRHEVNSHCI